MPSSGSSRPKDQPLEHGVVMSEILEVLPEPVADPWWVETVRDSFRHAGAG